MQAGQTASGELGRWCANGPAQRFAGPWSCRRAGAGSELGYAEKQAEMVSWAGSGASRNGL